jgi:hypothetical protein
MVGRVEGQSTMAGAYPPLTALGRALATSGRVLSRNGMELAAVKERELADMRHATRCVEVGAMIKRSGDDVMRLRLNECGIKEDERLERNEVIEGLSQHTYYL